MLLKGDLRRFSQLECYFRRTQYSFLGFQSVHIIPLFKKKKNTFSFRPKKKKSKSKNVLKWIIILHTGDIQDVDQITLHFLRVSCFYRRLSSACFLTFHSRWRERPQTSVSSHLPERGSSSPSCPASPRTCRSPSLDCYSG